MQSGLLPYPFLDPGNGFDGLEGIRISPEPLDASQLAKLADRDSFDTF